MIEERRKHDREQRLENLILTNDQFVTLSLASPLWLGSTNEQ